jgi:hypothetical protein
VASLLQQWALARAMGENGGGADKKKGLRRNS